MDLIIFMAYLLFKNMSRSSKACVKGVSRPQERVVSTDSNQCNQRQSLDKPTQHQAFLHPTKQVAIADYSEMRIYIRDRSYQSKKSYSSDAIQFFRVRASFEALRIRSLISDYSLQTWSAIDCVMGLGLLSHEELIGLEHLVCEKAAEQALRERRAHIDSVLTAQELLKEKYDNEVDTIMLAKFASMSSAKHVQKARTRATWSFAPEKNTSGADKKMETAPAIRCTGKLKPDIRVAFAA
ncbi:hypothetical protein ACHAW6_001193 [Cyclotella cf. meneghiniana]